MTNTSNTKLRGAVTDVQLGDMTCANVRYKAFVTAVDNPGFTMVTQFLRPQRDGLGQIDDLEIATPLEVGDAVEVTFQDGVAIMTLIDKETYATAECGGA